MGLIINSYRFAGGGGGGLATRWRMNITQASNAGAAWPSMAEMEMRSAIGGADECSGGTASASANTGTSGNIFDDNTGTRWTAGSTSVPVQVEYQFATAKTITQVSIFDSAANDFPTAFDIQYHDGSTWQTYWSETSTMWAANYKRVFTKYDSGTAGFFKWRLNITASRSGADWAGITELELRSSTGGADLTAPLSTANEGDLFGSGNNPVNAFDNNTGTLWYSGAVPSGGSPATLGYRFPTQTAITEISIRNTASLDESPKTIDVQYFDPAAGGGAGAWTTSWSIADTAFSSGGETKVFTKP